MKKIFLHLKNKLVATFAVLLIASSSFAQVNVLLCAADNTVWVAEVQARLIATGSFASVSVFDAATGTPSIPFLQTFQAVMVWTDNSPNNPVLLGNNLATYIDGGGGVVSAVFDNASIPIGGNFNTATYRVVNPASQTQGTPLTLGTVFFPAHPVMAGISSLNGGTSSYISTSASYVGGTVILANWSNGSWLAAVRTGVGPAGANRCDLNLFPPSTTSRADFWNTSTQGTELMRNALLWVGNRGAALNFDGVNDYVTTPYFAPTADMTIEFSMKSTGTQYGDIMSWAGNTNNSVEVMSNGGAVSFGEWNGSSWNVFVTTASLVNDGNWHHIEIVRRGLPVNTVTMYIDGVLSITTTGGGALLPTNQYSIGMENWFASYIRPMAAGSLDEIRVWNRALCQGEIVNNMNCEIPTTGSGLLANYHFNQGLAGLANPTITTLTDASGNAYTGTLTNFALTGATSNWLSPGAVASGVSCGAFVGPIITATASPSSICAGASATLTGGGGVGYLWNPGSSVANPYVVTPASTTTYTVTGTNAGGCTGTATTTVTVNALPIAAITGTNTICVGQSTTLTASGGSTYVWSTGATTAAITVSPVSNSVYTCTVTNVAGCTATATVSVTVNPLPIAAITGTNTICVGQSTTLTASGGGTYLWSNAATTAAITVSPLSTTVYTCTVTSVAGCTATATRTVTVNPLPTVTASTTASAVCAGSPVTLTGGGASTYTWSGGVTNAVSFVPVSTLTYTVTGTSAAGCTNTATVTVTVNPIPTVTANTTATAVCTGGSVTLTGGGASTYTWSGGVTNAVAFVPLSTLTYTVTGTSAAGCTNTATVTVTVNPLPTVTANTTATAVCAGSSVTLTGGGASTYTWSGGVTNAVSFVPVSTLTYTVTGTSVAGCTNTATVTVTVNPLPTVTAIATPATVCSGGNSVLSVTSTVPTTYCQPVYSTGTIFGDYASSVVLNTLNNPTGASTTPFYTLYPTSGNTTTTLTAGSTYTITLVAGTYTQNDVAAWIDYNQNGTLNNALEKLGETDNMGATPASTSFIFTVPLSAANGLTRLRVREMDHGGTNDMDPCTSQSVYGETEDYTITIVGGVDLYTYSWSPGTFLSSTVGSTVNATAVTATTTYTVTSTTGAGCSANSTATITVNPLPIVTANTTAMTVCAGGSVTLTGGGATTYTWTGGVLDGVSFVPVATATYTVTGTSALGCTNTATVTVTVNPLPTVTANSTASTLCAGGSVTLTGGGASTYTWDNSVVDGVSFVPTATTTYMVTGTDANGCMNTAMTTVTVNALPTVTANTTASTVCAGTSVTLTGGGASTYAWDNSVIDGVSFVPTATTTYMVTGTDANGCVNTATTTVTVNALPTVTANTTASAVCAGTSVTLTGGGASTYTWDNSVVDAVSFVPVATTTYMVTGTDANGCVNTAMTTVTVNPLPTVTANTTASTVCAGTSVTLTGGGASTYTWDNSIVDAVSFVPTTTTTYMVTGTDANGCVNTATTTVTVNALPVVNLGPDAAICSGSVTFDAQNIGSTYLWSDASTAQMLTTSASGNFYVDVTDVNGCVGSDTAMATINSNPTVSLGIDTTQCGGTVTLDAGNSGAVYTWSDGSTTQTITVSVSGTYYVTDTLVGGCYASDTIVVVINAIPTVTGTAASSVVCVDDAAVALTGTPTGGTWSGPGVTGSSFSPIGAGLGAQTATYSYTDSLTGCSATATAIITVNACVGVVESTLENGVNVYPNPNTGSFTLSVNANVGDMSIVMTDMQGRVVYSSMENNVTAGFTKQISMENAANGVYMLRLTTATEQQIVKVSVQK